MIDERPDRSGWPEPPGCPSCKAPNHLGSVVCWLCGAELPAPPEQVGPAMVSVPEQEPEPARRRGPWPWPRPRITLGTTMIGVGVVAVFLAVGQGKAGVLVGLALIVGPSVGYLVARVRRVGRGEDRPSNPERAFGEVSATILALSVSAAVLAAVVILGLQVARALGDAFL